jgi:hypothetical protein
VKTIKKFRNYNVNERRKCAGARQEGMWPSRLMALPFSGSTRDGGEEDLAPYNPRGYSRRTE